jgi:hypothetical protein
MRAIFTRIDDWVLWRQKFHCSRLACECDARISVGYRCFELLLHWTRDWFYRQGCNTMHIDRISHFLYSGFNIVVIVNQPDKKWQIQPLCNGNCGECHLHVLVRACAQQNPRKLHFLQKNLTLAFRNWFYELILYHVINLTLNAVNPH